MNRRTLALTILVLLAPSGIVAAQYTTVRLLPVTGLGLTNDWTTVRAEPGPQTLSMFLDIGAGFPPRLYANPRGLMAIALDDPNWTPHKILPFGAVHLNPANLVLYQINYQMKLVTPNWLGQHRYVGWGRLPQISSKLIGSTFVMQVLCWETTGKPRYTVSNPVRLVVVPR